MIFRQILEAIMIKMTNGQLRGRNPQTISTRLTLIAALVASTFGTAQAQDAAKTAAGDG